MKKIIFLPLLLLVCSCSVKKDPNELVEKFLKTVSELESCEYAVDLDFNGTNDSFNEVVINRETVASDLWSFDMISESDYGVRNVVINKRSNNSDFVSSFLLVMAWQSIEQIYNDSDYTLSINADTVVFRGPFYGMKILFNKQYLPVYIQSLQNNQPFSTIKFTYKSINKTSRDIISKYEHYIRDDEDTDSYDYDEDYDEDEDEETLYDADHDFEIFYWGSIWVTDGTDRAYAGLEGVHPANDKWTLISFKDKKYTHVNTIGSKDDLPIDEEGEEFSYCFPETIVEGISYSESDSYSFAVKGDHKLGKNDISILSLKDYVPSKNVERKAFKATSYYEEYDGSDASAFKEAMHLGKASQIEFNGYVYSFITYQRTEDDSYEYNLIGYCNNTDEGTEATERLTTYCEGEVQPFTIDGNLYIYVSLGSCGEGAWSAYAVYLLEGGEFKKVFKQYRVCD